MEKILLNKNIIEHKQVIDIEDRGYQFGDGIYEVIGVYNHVPFRLENHLERLFSSAKKIGIDIGVSKTEIKNRILKLQKQNGLQNGLIYIQITRGTIEREHYVLDKDKLEPNIVSYVIKRDRNTTDIWQNGVPIILTEDIRWLRCDIKSLNLLPNVLAKQKAVEKKAFEAVFFRENEIITEGSSTNIFVIKDDVVYTHPANNYILNGITRQTVLELCDKQNLTVIEKAFSKNFLFNADEVFLTGTYLDILPVKEIINEKVSFPITKNITLRLIEEFQKLTS